MTSYRRRHSETEPDAEERVEAASLAREAGARAFKAWRDSVSPPPAPIAMRAACPYRREDPLTEEFFKGWREDSGPRWTHVHRGEPCRILARHVGAVEIETRAGERRRTSWKSVRELSA